MIDWEDVWDNVKDVIRLVFLLGFILCSTLLFTNNIINTNDKTPVQTAVFNNTNYTCMPIDTHINWTWDFTFHEGHFLIYLFAFIITTVLTLFMLGIIFGYIPICGCGHL